MEFAGDIRMPRKPWKTDKDQLLEGAQFRLRREKLAAPSVASHSIERRAIVELVTAAAGAKLILFRAPAGYGKTTAMRQYFDHLQRNGVATAWLTLDARDENFHRLLIHVIAAFDKVLIAMDADWHGERVGADDGNIDRMAIDLMDQVADCAYPFTLFIDEYEAVTNRSIDDFLRLILTRLPPHGQIAIASRETPNVQLGRLRALGQLVEVDQLRLQFSRHETDTFLRLQCALPLTDADVMKLHGDTEGWPAALWLAATALEHREQPQSFIATFSGSNAAVAEYLAEDLLTHQPEAVQEFLLKTSILKELNKSLCDAVCERLDSETLLNRLVRSNVCVTTRDSDHPQYRYNGLFAEFLCSQLEHLCPQEIPELHRRAAGWYEAEGRPVPAIEHAIAAGDAQYALALLLDHVKQLLRQGRFRLLAGWFDMLPKDQMCLQPRLRVAQIWALTFTDRGGQALELLEALGHDDTAVGHTDNLMRDLNAFRPTLMAILDRKEEALALAEKALNASLPKDDLSQTTLTSTLANLRLAANRYADAMSLLRHSGPGNEGEDRTLSNFLAIGVEGLVDLVQGRVRQAIAQFRVALGEAGAGFGGRSIGKSIAAVHLAEALYEIDEFAEAEQLLALYLPTAREYGIPDQVVISHVLLARIAFDRGDVDHAFRRLSELEYFGRRCDLARVFACAQLERARLALLRGDTTDARTHYERASTSDAWSGVRGMITPANDVETVLLCRYRLLVHGVGGEGVGQSLKSEIRLAKSLLRNRRALKLTILLAKVLHTSGQHSLAMRTLQEALQTASQDGLVRCFLDEGVPVIDLLREFRVARKASAQEDDALISFVDRILARGGVRFEQETAKDSDMDTSASLTTRELQTLESVSLGLSNVALAKKLFVSENTVRSRLRKINAKLGVRNRTEAVSVARHLGLIK